MGNFICGANEEGFHYSGVNWSRDLPEPQRADLRNVVDGDPDPQGGRLAIQRGIEVGHVFFLGDKYSRALNATFLETDGKPALLQMGRSEEHTSELQSLMRISYAVFCLKKKKEKK